MLVQQFAGLLILDAVGGNPRKERRLYAEPEKTVFVQALVGAANQPRLLLSATGVQNFGRRQNLSRRVAAIPFLQPVIYLPVYTLWRWFTEVSRSRLHGPGRGADSFPLILARPAC
jgi:hypothetical protein